ncbi:MAG: PAS domain-containing protein, partial [Nocardioides sp.]
MEDSLQGERLVRLAHVCATAVGADDLLDASVPLLRELSGADSAAVYRFSGDDHRVVASAGVDLDPVGFADVELEVAETLVAAPVPAAWAAAGVVEVSGRRRADDPGYLVLAWSGSRRRPEPAVLDVAFACLDGAATRLRSVHRYADLVQRGNKSQQLANMGDYDWHIASNSNRWSDQLFRIYGYEPGEIDPTYEVFLAHVHPDDRERIQGIHQHAYATGEPFEMIERIVRPDGELRFLSSNGQVVLDASGTPVRMRGTCLDITDQVHAERATERSATRFRGLVESSPDAILVLDRAGQILHANHRAHELLEGDPLGRSIHDVLPDPELAGQGLVAASLAGGRLQLDVTTASLSQADDEGVTAVFLHDAGVRLANEAVAARLREARVRRRQALEINDNVVQGLSAAVVALDQADLTASIAQVDRTLAAARQMMNDLLDQLDGEDL